METLDASRPAVPSDTVPSKHESLHATLCHVPLAAVAERDYRVFQGRRRQGSGDRAYWLGTNGGWTCVTVDIYLGCKPRIQSLRGDSPLRSIRLHLLQLFLHILSTLHVPHDIIQRDNRDDGNVEFLFNLLHGGAGTLLSSFLTVDELDDADEFCFGMAFQDGDGFTDRFLEDAGKSQRGLG